MNYEVITINTNNIISVKTLRLNILVCLYLYNHIVSREFNDFTLMIMYMSQYASDTF